MSINNSHLILIAILIFLLVFSLGFGTGYLIKQAGDPAPIIIEKCSTALVE